MGSRQHSLNFRAATYHGHFFFFSSHDDAMAFERLSLNTRSTIGNLTQ